MKLAMIAASLILIGPAQAQTLKEKYELSAQCGKQAAETFRKDGKGFPSKRANYENHYNSRLNKCFYIEITTTYERKIGLSRVMRLYDLYENKEIAGYDKLVGACYAQEKQCKSEEEWRDQGVYGGLKLHVANCDFPSSGRPFIRQHYLKRGNQQRCSTLTKHPKAETRNSTFVMENLLPRVVLGHR